MGNKGNGNYHPITEVTPDPNGCWENQGPRSYQGSRGIAEIYYLVVVDRAQADNFAAIRRAKKRDGIAQDQWESLQVANGTLLTFEVQTG